MRVSDSVAAYIFSRFRPSLMPRPSPMLIFKLFHAERRPRFHETFNQLVVRESADERVAIYVLELAVVRRSEVRTNLSLSAQANIECSAAFSLQKK